jgi:hypothetical protein
MNNDKWTQCFEQFRKLSFGAQQCMRSYASMVLVEEGAEEVGSSDVNHQLFAMWEQCNENWSEVILAALTPIEMNINTTE